MRLARKRLALKGDVQVLEMMTRWLLQTQLSGHASWGFYSCDPGLASLAGHPSKSRPRDVYRPFVRSLLLTQWISPVPSDLFLFFQKLLAFLLGAGESVQRGCALARSQAPPCLYVSQAVSLLNSHPPLIFLLNTLSGEGACERVQILLGPPVTGVLHCHPGPHSAVSNLFRLLADLSLRVCVCGA